MSQISFLKWFQVRLLSQRTIFERIFFPIKMKLKMTIVALKWHSSKNFCTVGKLLTSALKQQGHFRWKRNGSELRPVHRWLVNTLSLLSNVLLTQYVALKFQHQKFLLILLILFKNLQTFWSLHLYRGGDLSGDCLIFLWSSLLLHCRVHRYYTFPSRENGVKSRGRTFQCPG